MPVRLPQELADYVLDYLHYDRKTLSACSLVCHDWLHSSRSHKFHSIPISPSHVKDREFLQYTRSTDIEVHARDLTVFFGMTEPLVDMSGFVNLRRLKLCYFPIKPIYEMSASSSFQFPNLTELELHMCQFSSRQDFARLLCTFPLLQSLSVQDIDIHTSQSNDGVSEPVLLSPLFSGYLRLGLYPGIHDVTEVLTSISCSPNGVNFFSVELEIGYSDSCSSDINTLLRACGANVYNLNIHMLNWYGDRICPIDLSSNTNLRVFTWRSSPTNEKLTPPMQILYTIRSPRIEVINLTLRYGNFGNSESDWDKLDELLSTTRFDNLKRLWITYTDDRFIAYMKDGLVRLDRLPRLHERGNVLVVLFDSK